MILSEVQEEFLRDFFKRQREISAKSLEETSTLAKANIEGIVNWGIESPPTIDKVEAILDQLKKEKAKELAKLQKELNSGKSESEGSAGPD
jgi:phage host-nuclease inhibitor protein Gam